MIETYLIAIVDNWDTYLAMGVASVIFFDRLAKLVPTMKANGTVSILYKILAMLGAKVNDNPGKE